VLHLHRGRISSSEMSLWLGMEEEHVKLVSSWLCGQNNDTRTIVHQEGISSSSAAASSKLKSEENAVCKVYNPTKQQNEYALVGTLQANLRERIACIFESPTNLSESGSSYCPSLDAIRTNPKMLSLSHNPKKLFPATIDTLLTKELACEMELTCEDTLWLMDGIGNTTSNNVALSKTTEDKANRISRGPSMTVHDSQGDASKWALEHTEEQIHSNISGVTIPTSLESLFGQESCQDITATAETFISIVNSLCEKGVLPGILSTPSSTSISSATSSSASNSNKATSSSSSFLKSAIYTPHKYLHLQQKMIHSFYESNGYLTEKKCLALGLSRSRMEKFVKESFPSAILLTRSIIDPIKICRPLENILQDAILNQSFANLMPLLPEDIASSEEDVKSIIHDHIMTTPSLAEGEQQSQQLAQRAFGEGLTIIHGEMALFFCRNVVQQSKQLLVPLLDEFCKQRAKEIVNESITEEDIAKQQDHNMMIPLWDVAVGVGEKYPDLMELQHLHDGGINHNSNATTRSLLWNMDETNDNEAKISDGPLVEFCRRALYSVELQRMCTRSLTAEVHRLHSTHHGLSVSTRSDGAARIQSLGDSFESSFRTLCSLLQIYAKSIDTLGARAQQQGSMDNTDVTLMVKAMEEELLWGCGSNLAKLITEYFLYKHAGEMESEGERNGLFFERSDEMKPKHRIGVVGPSDFHATDMALLHFQFVELKCHPDTNGKSQSPLNYLRKTFPGSTGISLSQMWDLCSKNDGASEEDDSINGTGKKLDSFISHLSETCLTLVGVPFSVLDKKTERKVLAARREAMLDRLEKSHDKEEVAMLAFVLIYHQVKNVAIVGMETINSLLERLCEQPDKKIPRHVITVIQSLKTGADDCDELSNLMSHVKKLGSAKNSKALAAIDGE